MGTLQDWNKLLTRTESLSQYAIEPDDEWTVYLQHISVILKQFIRTYENDVDVSFWNTIFKSEQQHQESGVDGGDIVQGWILHFIGKFLHLFVIFLTFWLH